MDFKKQKSLLTLNELCTATFGSVVGNSKEVAGFESVAIDSRNVTVNSLFVPLIGEFQNGHAYIPQAIKNGASIIFVAKAEYETNKPLYEELASSNKVVFVIVENTLKALQAAASCYVAKFPNLIKVGITGSSGKTTTKELVVSVLKEKYKVVYSKGNFNSETGLPLSVFNIKSDDEVGVFEMGMNHKNEILDLAQILQPKYAIVTNIGTAHIGLLGSRENIAAEKRQIFNFIGKDGVAFIPLSDDFSDFLADGVEGRIVHFGLNTKDSEISSVKDLGIEGTDFSFRETKIHLYLPGTYNFLNATAAVALGKELGLDSNQIKDGIEKLRLLDGRSEILHITTYSGKHLTVLQDCYNANPDSMEKAVSLFNTIKTQKCLILGDMLELGEESKTAHSGIGKLCSEIAKNGNTLLLFIGPEMEYAKETALQTGFEVNYSSKFDDKSLQFQIQNIEKKIENNSYVLIKASHGIGLERVVKMFQEED